MNTCTLTLKLISPPPPNCIVTLLVIIKLITYQNCSTLDFCYETAILKNVLRVKKNQKNFNPAFSSFSKFSETEMSKK